MHTINPSPGEGPVSGNECGLNPIVDFLLQEKLLAPKQVEYATRVRTKLETPRPLLEVLKELKLIADDQIKKAVKDSRISMCIGNILVELGYIKPDDLQRALDIQAADNNSRKIGEILLEHRLIDEQVLIEVLSLQMGFPEVEPEFTEIDQELFAKAPAKWYESHDVIPIQKQADGVLIAFMDPLDGKDLEAVKQIFGDKFVPAIARRNAIKRAVGMCQSGNLKKDLAASDENSIIRLADEILRAAVERDTSDIHLEPLKNNMRVRFRQDGVLIHFQDFPAEIMPALTNRIKVLCEVDITEKRRHQGGRFCFDYPGGQIDLRVSFYVTVHGEKIVMRLLNRKGVLLDIDDISLSRRIRERFKEDALYVPSGVIIITGPTGSGKSSLVNLLPRFYDYDCGSLTLDGTELVEYPIHWLRQQIGIVEQEPFLFSRTIRENIAYGSGREVTDKEIEEAAQAAAIHDVILSFPEGYNTLVGEKGVTLSGGQKQRVAIARTLLKDPRILVLDDATSSVDTETEALIREALERLMEGRTSFIIAHRIQTIMQADKILVLDKGRIVQQGAHRELIQQDGLYKQIYELQAQVEQSVGEVGHVGHTI